MHFPLPHGGGALIRGSWVHLWTKAMLQTEPGVVLHVFLITHFVLQLFGLYALALLLCAVLVIMDSGGGMVV